ncbi:peptidylprolyl isomerase [Noviherbaspirillum aerium]|uniref:peptidylprolyl isomerase n=1 Tax=Noviherbaspirillum aerium TaxID=2588497 RepID=UPI00124BF3F7|nr:peptidylprolyl isomerase [Noviherbaspirillum aerium]
MQTSVTLVNSVKTGCAALLSGVLMYSAQAAESEFLTVNGSRVSQATADVFIAQAKAHGMPAGAELKDQVREELIRRELLSQEARKAGIDKKPDVAARAETERQRIMAQAEAAGQTVIIRAYIEDYLRKHPVSDADLKAEYQAQRAKGGNTDYKIRHVLLRSDKEARAIIARLDKGAAFEELARDSIDPGTRDNGGDLGWSVPGKFAKPFAQAVTSLKPGKYTGTPVKTEFGYHVIKLEETRPLKVPSFDEMKPLLKRQAEEQALKTMIDGLRSKAKVEY